MWVHDVCVCVMSGCMNVCDVWVHECECVMCECMNVCDIWVHDVCVCYM